MATKFIEKEPSAYFQDAGIPSKIEYKPKADSEDLLCFKYYNAEEVLLGKTMQEWLRFSVVYWHTFRWAGADPFGLSTANRPWEDGTDTLANAKRRMRVAFEFFKRLGAKYYTFHDRDISPEGSSLAESNRNLDEMANLALELQKQTGVKLLWATCNLFSNPRYANGAGTNPDAHVVAFAGAQLKKNLEIAKKLDSENFIFWGGREGYQSLLNTDMKSELTHMAQLFKMAVAYKNKIGFKGQFCIEPKPKEPVKHQYDYDAMTVIGFLQHFGLDNDFKLNVEPNHTTMAGHDYLHDVALASNFGMLGSIDANTGSPDLGWDTDQFPMDIKNCTLLMKIIIDQGGLAPGGLNFDCKVRRESIDIRDMFIAHIGAMDSLARGLRNAAKIVEDGILASMLNERYLSFKNTEIGKAIESGKSSLEDCEEYIKKNGEPTPQSGRQEYFEAFVNRYI